MKHAPALMKLRIKGKHRENQHEEEDQAKGNQTSESHPVRSF